MFIRNTPLHLALLLLATAPLHAGSIVGSWYATNAGEARTDVVITFLSNGTYVLAEDGNSKLDPSGKDGMERGTYKWNETTGVFTNKTLVDTNGEWGLSSEEKLKVTVSGATLTLDGVKFKKVASATNKIVGSWYLKEGGGYAVVTFLADGTYFMVQDVKRTIDEWSGVERGTYKWNSSTKVFTRKVLVDTNGGLGFSSDDKRTINVAGKRLTLRVVDDGGDGSATLAKVVAP